MPCQTSVGTHSASVPWTASRHGPVRVSDEITGAGKCRIRSISDVAILWRLWFCWWQDNSNFDSLIYSFQWTRAKGEYGVRLLPLYAAFRMPGCKIMTPTTCRAQMRQFSDGKMEYISACNITWPHKNKGGGTANSDSHYESCSCVWTTQSLAV